MNQESFSLRNLSNCIRFLSIDAVQKAKSGHPGMPMGMADIATVLFKDFLKFDPNDPEWPDRDRFVLSNGHGSMLLYSCLYLSGYKKITLNEIMNFRQLNSLTAGHPEYNIEAGIETTTGPLSQGFANSVGMALGERILNAKFGDKIVNHYTYVFAGDGCLMEGLSHEAASFAGHLKLKKLIVFFDNNSISIDGSTKLSVSDNHEERFKSQGWSTLSIDGHNHEEIKNAIKIAKNNDKPTLISCKTKIGFGSPNKENSSSSHGSPLGEDEVILTRKNLNWDYEKFFIPKELLENWRNFYKRNKKEKDDWETELNKSNEKDSFKKYTNNISLNKKIEEKINEFKRIHIENKTECATRKASEKSLELLTQNIDIMIGGSADLTGSNNTKASFMNAITNKNFKEKYIYYGVREHAMGSIMNGMSLHKGIIPYGGTFLVFSDYCRPAIRLAALMKLQIIYVMTHDSIGLGEDGPTHQPIEHLASLKAIPNLNVYRPADIIETIESWQSALNTKNTPSILVLSRQNLPLLRQIVSEENLTAKGAYVIKNTSNYDITILSSGSEVSIALEASKELKKNNIEARVVSVVCWELFENQNEEYKSQTIGNKECFAIEAAVYMSWAKYVKEKNFVGMSSFGASAPYKQLYDFFGISSKNLVKKILDYMKKNEKN